MIALHLVSSHNDLPNNGEETMAYVKMMDLGFEEFDEAIHYDPETGRMTWKVAPCRRMRAGDEVGGVKPARIAKKSGKEYRYRYVSFKNRQTPAARVAWLLSHGEWPNTTVLFKDGDPTNLRLSNLKLAEFPTDVVKKGGRKIYKMSRAAQRHYGLKRYYGITPEMYGEMMAAQKGCCSICGKPETAVFNGNIKMMHVDHCHETNMLRDLLCNNCNNMLGHAKDKPEILRAAADYIERHAQRTDNVVFIKKKGSTA